MTRFEVQKELECDYNVQPTNIYLLIQELDWQGVVYQAETFPIEVQTYVFRKENQKMKWRVLPIHASILNGAPGYVVSSLLRAYPQSAKCTDDQGMLPIHLAIKKHVGPEIINNLLYTFPECVDVKSGNTGMTPREMAKKSNSVHKKYYLRAMRKGSATYLAVSNPVSDLLCGLDYKSIIGIGPSTLLARASLPSRFDPFPSDVPICMIRRKRADPHHLVHV